MNRSITRTTVFPIERAVITRAIWNLEDRVQEEREELIAHARRQGGGDENIRTLGALIEAYMPDFALALFELPGEASDGLETRTYDVLLLGGQDISKPDTCEAFRVEHMKDVSVMFERTNGKDVLRKHKKSICGMLLHRS